MCLVDGILIKLYIARHRHMTQTQQDMNADTQKSFKKPRIHVRHEHNRRIIRTHIHAHIRMRHELTQDSLQKIV